MDDLEQLTARAHNFDAVLTRNLYSAISRALVVAEDEARTVHSWQNRTGETLSTIEWAMVSSNAGVLRAGPNARRLNFGTQPHIIRPKEGHGFVGPVLPGQTRRGKNDIGTHRVALRWQQGGETRFATLVHHPGTQPTHFLEHAGDVAWTWFLVQAESAVESALKEILG